jgi:putative transcriptional regulator
VFVSGDLKLDHALTGQFLVAMPGMADERFAETVIFVCAHGEEGAMGLVINREIEDLQFADLMSQFELGGRDDSIRVPNSVTEKKILIGGPVETNRGFVLHSADYYTADSSLRVNDEICLTATVDVLRAMVHGNGPSESLLMLGYCGWGAGQLENEIKDNGWLTVPHSAELLFSTDIERRYDAALAAIGVSRAQLSSQSGHA